MSGLDKRASGFSDKPSLNVVITCITAENVIPLFDYPDEIRRIIYTTNAIESLNSVIRKAINNRKIFPDDKSALKVIYLAVRNASKKWTMPIRDWKPALNRFMLERA